MIECTSNQKKGGRGDLFEPDDTQRSSIKSKRKSKRKQNIGSLRDAIFINFKHFIEH